MKNKEEPSAHSLRGNPSVQVDLHFPDDAGTETTGSPSRPGDTAAAWAEQPALSLFPESLMEAVVDPDNIDKPDGGRRDLGIPNVIERLIQQAIAQVLTPVFDPTFSESSHGFRPQ